VSKADVIKHLEAERDDLVDSPGDGHPERVAEIEVQLKGLGVDTGEWRKQRREERDRLAAQVDEVRQASGDEAADQTPAADRLAKLDAHLPGKAAKHG
jgi:hypothetical protein